ncbi:MAG: universal stress protein [Acidimicrobiales bacterium]|nr:universal stress protein [Acidimicrobiales bacterium]
MTESTGPIVVGVDGSHAAVTAVRWAAAEARLRHRGLRLIHATEEVSLNSPKALPAHLNLRDVLQIRGRRWLGAARDAAREVAPELDPHLVLSHDTVLSALQTESESANLLVLGVPDHRSPLGRALAGSVATSLAARGACPLALVRGHVAEDHLPTDGPVVVGLDGSPASEEALALAFEEASLRHALLVAVHSWDDRLANALFGEARSVPDRSEADVHERDLIEHRLAAWREKYPDVDAEVRVLRGRPAQRVLDLADHAQLIVVGSRGFGSVTGMLLGSTSRAVMTYALCPVLVVRAQEA